MERHDIARQSAIDQQPYLQGYLAVESLWLQHTNANVTGSGQPVLTGPYFVDQSNVEQVAKFAAAERADPFRPRSKKRTQNAAFRLNCEQGFAADALQPERSEGDRMILHARRPSNAGPWLVRDQLHTIADLIWPRPELAALNVGVDAYFEAEPRPGGGWHVKGLAPIQDWD